ncbi:hypothetical protein LSCM1_01553 [Leishmania martiniquensis]|uniref:Uncharacterized protein n=1 Tax=Leishmania martiniquensis TaxID=1580590 RepID=A0A836GDH0_9TRYP|nr:hypothetical protein LSCM1_01553 [Leishmania martiniquensis]
MSSLSPRAEKERADMKDTGGVPLSPLRLPTRRQFVVEKQGSFDYTFWDTRILTIDTQHGRIYLSKSQNAANLDHRCMSRIDSVELWPKFNFNRICEPWGSEVAKLTLCMKGLVGTKSESFLMRLLRGGAVRRKGVGDISAPVAEARDAAAPSQRGGASCSRSQDTIEASVLSPTSDYHSFDTEVWMLRCMTRADLYKMAEALRAAIPEASLIKGYHGLKKKRAGRD